VKTVIGSCFLLYISLDTLPHLHAFPYFGSLDNRSGASFLFFDLIGGSDIVRMTLPRQDHQACFSLLNRSQRTIIQRLAIQGTHLTTGITLIYFAHLKRCHTWLPNSVSLNPKVRNTVSTSAVPLQALFTYYINDTENIFSHSSRLLLHSPLPSALQSYPSKPTDHVFLLLPPRGGRTPSCTPQKQNTTSSPPPTPSPPSKPPAPVSNPLISKNNPKSSLPPHSC